MAMNPAWPRLTWPAIPVSRSRPTIVRQKMPVMFSARMSPAGMMRGTNNMITAMTAAPARAQVRGSTGGA